MFALAAALLLAPPQDESRLKEAWPKLVEAWKSAEAYVASPGADGGDEYLRAAGKLHEDFTPAPGGFIQNRASRVLGEAVTLLEEIVDDTLLNAIADGTFGIMKRPANRGKGLDGVAKHEPGYYNPATEILEAGR